MGAYRSASFKVSMPLLFELFGMKGFDGRVVDAQPDFGGDCITIKVSGDDQRLPDSTDYPECNVVAKTVASHLEIIE